MMQVWCNVNVIHECSTTDLWRFLDFMKILEIYKDLFEIFDDYSYNLF